MEHPILLQPMTPEDWQAVRSIYLQGIATGNATFQQSAPEWEEWDAAHVKACRIVARSGQEVAGWAALGTVSKRPVYAGVAEVSLYVAEAVRGRRIGHLLLNRLIAESEAAGIWTLQAGIFPENNASIRVHTNAGFRIVGIRSRLGCMNGRWRDVVLMERRSVVAGI
jgi:L-amino acid N-acyltransferase YncA